MDPDADSVLYPNVDDAGGSDDGPSRRTVLATGAAVGAAATAGCGGSDDGGDSADDGGDSADDGGDPANGDGSSDEDTVFVFNTGEGTVSLLDPEADELIETRAVGLSSSFPSNQYTPELTEDAGDSLWLNVGRGVRGLSVGSLSETASVETGSGANWVEQTPDGAHVVVSAREPSHRQVRIDADPASESFGEVTGEIDRRSEGGMGDNDGPGPCDVTIHPDGEVAYVPDIFGDTLTVLRIDPFEILSQIEVDPVDDGPSRPWMATVAPDGETLLVEHDEGDAGTESIWDTGDPAAPTLVDRVTPSDGLGRRPLTSEIGPASERGYVFTPGSNDVTLLDLASGTVTDTLDLGGSAFVGTWDPRRGKLYAPVQMSDEVAVIDHDRTAVVERIPVGPSPYGATAASVRPGSDPGAAASLAMTRLGLTDEPAETTYCIGQCSCGHRL